MLLLNIIRYNNKMTWILACHLIVYDLFRENTQRQRKIVDRPLKDFVQNMFFSNVFFGGLE
jgi:hypothetical protein